MKYLIIINEIKKETETKTKTEKNRNKIFRKWNTNENRVKYSRYLMEQMWYVYVWVCEGNVTK